MSTYNSKILMYVVIIVFLVGFTILSMSKRTEAPDQDSTKPQQVQPITTDDIVVNSPLPGTIIKSGTLTVSGEARGTWYFEASAPFEVVDADNKVIAVNHVNALGEWMTTQFVPFAGTIEVTVPEHVTSGYVVFKNDNPSDDRSRDKEVRVPVVFQ